MRALWILALVACAPMIDGPAERARAADRDDAARLAAQLRALPAIVATEVVLRRPVRDPFANSAAAGYASVVIVVHDPAYRSAVSETAARLVRAVVPEIDHPEIVVETRPPAPKLASVGPFTVSASAKPRLVVTLIAGMLLIAALAGYIAWRERSRAT